MKKIIVTGAAGKLGGEFLKQFHLKYQIIACDIKEHLSVPEGVQYLKIDIACPHECHKLFAHTKNVLGAVDGFVHCAAISAPGRDQKLTFEVNLKGTFYLLQECVENQVKQVVLATSGWVQGLPSPHIKPVRFPIDESTRGVYTDVYHISKRFNEDNARMHIDNGQLSQIVSLRYGGIIDTEEDGLKGLATEPYWTRITLKDAARALDCSLDFAPQGFSFYLIGSQFRYQENGEKESKEKLQEKLEKWQWSHLFVELEPYEPGKQTFDLTKSLRELKFSAEH